MAKNDFIMLPTVDFCFKELMQDAKVREGFISALLDVEPLEVRETTLLPTIMEGDYPEEKQSILDVRVLLRDGRQIDMEMQVANYQFWDKRTIYYLGKMCVEQLKRGDPYNDLKGCCLVSILDFDLYKDDSRCYRTISLRDNDTYEQYSDLIEIKILELNKLPDTVPESGSVYDWMRFFRGKTKEEFKIMAQEYEYFDVAYNRLVKLSADDVKRLEYENRERNIRDFMALESYSRDLGRREGIEEGIERGREEGIEKGREEGMEQKLVQQIERKMAKGKTAEQIADELEETPERITALMAQMDVCACGE